MNDNGNSDEVRDLQVRAVTNAVVSLVNRLGYPPEVVMDGAMRAAAVVSLSATDATIDDTADLFEHMGEAFRGILDKPKLSPVQ